mgnify:FL=1|tara:strand:- start:27 stop:614 length:588 start_codon:yes stop_codon:yes gene_type:complete
MTRFGGKFSNKLFGEVKLERKKFDGTCRYCGTTLVLGDNWNDYSKRNGHKLCASCKNKENSGRMFVNGKYVSVHHPLYKAGHYKSFNDAAFSSLKNYDKCKSGYVYVVSNPAWEGWYKIGKAVDAEDRCKGYQTSSPFRDYVLKYHKKFHDRNKAEKIAHRKTRKLAIENNAEWFKLSLDNIINIIDGIKNEVSA